MILTTPLKSWRDQEGNEMHRLGDLPIDILFTLEPGGQKIKAITYPRSTHTGKRQCQNLETKKYQYINCTQKVYVVSEEDEK
jgi:hypothetical protein